MLNDVGRGCGDFSPNAHRGEGQSEEWTAAHGPRVRATRRGVERTLESWLPSAELT